MGFGIINIWFREKNLNLKADFKGAGTPIKS
jgi:hypothetical protein